MKNIEKLFDRWAAGTAGRKTREGHYFINADDKTFEYRGKGRHAGEGVDVIAMRLKDGTLVCNASKFERCGSYRKGTISPMQKYIDGKNLPMLPLSVFTEAKLKLAGMRIINRTGSEDVTVAKREWNTGKGEYETLEPKTVQTFTKDPTADEDKIILTCAKGVQKRHVVDKDGTEKRDKDGNCVYKEGDVWEAVFIDKNRLEARHFIGAILLRLGKRHFLFDVDRNEVGHYRFNPFLVELAAPAKTVAEAYKMLKPQAVLDAEKKGVPVVRQGEWFFIKTDREIAETDKVFKGHKDMTVRVEKAKPELDAFALPECLGDAMKDSEGGALDYKEVLRREMRKIKPEFRAAALKRVAAFNRQAAAFKKLDDECRKRHADNQYYSYGGELKAGLSRPNRVGTLARIKGVSYVEGGVKHTGREHEDVELKGWHLAVPNTAVKSWTITGDID